MTMCCAVQDDEWQSEEKRGQDAVRDADGDVRRGRWDALRPSRTQEPGEPNHVSTLSTVVYIHTGDV